MLVIVVGVVLAEIMVVVVKGILVDVVVVEEDSSWPACD